MAHRYGTNPGMICRESEEDELLADVVRDERRREWEGNCKCGEPLRADGGCQLCDEDRAKEIPFACGALFTILLLCIPAFGQAAGSGPWLYSGPAVYGALAGAPAFYAALPQVWVDNNELECGYGSYLPCWPGSPGLSLAEPLYELTLGTGWSSYGAPPSFCNTALTGSPWTTTASGLQSALVAIEACRTAGLNQSTPVQVGIILDVPPSGNYANTVAPGFLIPQTSTVLASAPLIVRSSAYATLAAMPKPVGAGGIQDNVNAIGVTAVGMDNPDGTGTNMYYENGPQNPCTISRGSSPCPGTITGITTVSVNTTATSAENGGGTSLAPGTQVINLTNGYVSPLLAPSTTASNSGCASGYVSVDTGANQECLQPASVANQTGLAVTSTKTHTFPFAVSYVPDNGGATDSACSGAGTFLLANYALVGHSGACKNISQYNYLQYMPQLSVSAAASFPLVLCGPVSTQVNVQCAGSLGPDDWEFQYLALSLAVGDTHPDQYLIETGLNAPAHATSTCTTAPFAESCYTNYAHHIHFNGLLVHGDWTCLACGANSIDAAVDFSGCYYCSFTDSQISQVLHPGSEGHAIYSGGNAEKIVNNWLEGQSSGIFAGGISSALTWYQREPNTDLQAGRNRITFPYSWLGMMTIPASNPNFSSVGIVRKNCNEFKVGQRLLYYGSILENVDSSGGQGGVCFADLANGSSMPNYSITDVTVQYMILRNFNNSFTDSNTRGPSSDGGPTFQQARFSFSHILGYSITNANPGGPTGNNYGSRIGGGAQSCNALVSETSGVVTAQCFASVDQGVNITGATCPSAIAGSGYCDYATSGQTLAQNQALCGGSGGGEFIFVYGFVNPYTADNSTTSGLQCYATTGTPTASLITLANASGYSGTVTGQTAFGNPILAATAASFNAVGNWMTMDMLSGDPAFLGGCTGVTGFNMPINSSFHNVATGIGPLVITGNSPWGGTYQGYAAWTSSMATVTYPWPSTYNAQSDYTGSCILSNGEGGPPNLNWNHLGLIGPALQESIYPIQTYANGRTSCAITPF